MTVQSIVDFFKEAQATPKKREEAEPNRLRAEEAYVEFAKPVLSALSDKPQLSERELYAAVAASDFDLFRAALSEHQSRGLVQIVDYQKPFGDAVYSLASGVRRRPPA